MERPDPAPGPHDVVLRMRAVALNYRDLAIARGHYHIQVRPPLVPLSDGAGEVVAVGGKVTRFRVGDLACPLYFPDFIDGPIGARVARRRLGGPTDGVLSEMMCVNEEEAVRAPKHLARRGGGDTAGGPAHGLEFALPDRHGAPRRIRRGAGNRRRVDRGAAVCPRRGRPDHRGGARNASTKHGCANSASATS